MGKKKQTKQERIADFLVKVMKAEEVKSTSSKYRKFFRRDKAKSYWLGKAGAVRWGRTVSSAISVTDIIEIKMKQWEREIATKAPN